jgi:hypothetical protein
MMAIPIECTGHGKRNLVCKQPKNIIAEAVFGNKDERHSCIQHHSAGVLDGRTDHHDIEQEHWPPLRRRDSGY